MNEPAKQSAPLDDVMLAMDVVDTLRHRQDLVIRELNEDVKRDTLIEKLRDIYAQQGIEVPDHILQEGVEALNESRFTYTPPQGGGLNVALAKLYVSRGKWGRWVLGSVTALIIAIAGYQFAYLPMKAAQADAARVELAEGLPARMDALYQAIYEDTKVQAAATQAAELVRRGKIAAGEGNRAEAEQAIADLTALRDTIRAEYSLRVINRPGERSGFWTFPEDNEDATNYYIVVEAIDDQGETLSLPIYNEESGEMETVSKWGVRVPESVYDNVAADKQDNGIIDRNIVGRKAYGFLDIDYLVPVSGGTITRW